MLKFICSTSLAIFMLFSLQLSASADAFEANAKLGRAINLGNALDAPDEGEWGVVLQEEYFKIIAEAGFDGVRIPIRWSAHALEEAPYTIDPEWFDRVDWAIENSLENDLTVVMNMHHYNEIFENPADHEERFLALWKQIAEHYKDLPQSVYFEFLNEPHDELDAELWNSMLAKVLKQTREIHPDRIVVIGPADWNSRNALDELELPEDDWHIIVTVHYYDPFHFTHQGAGWVGQNADEWLGTSWTGTEEQKQEIIEDFDLVKQWSETNDRPIFVGEFGAYSKAGMESRAQWTSFVRETLEDFNFSWAYWEFCAGFGAYDRNEEQWREPLIKALIPGWDD